MKNAAPVASSQASPKCECGHSVHIHGERQSEVVRPCLAIEPGQPAPAPTGVKCGCQTYRPATVRRGTSARAFLAGWGRW